MNGTELTDDALRTIAECPSIQRLALSATSVTAAGLAQLKKLPHLEELCLDIRLLDKTEAVTELVSFPSLKTVKLVGYGDSEDNARYTRLRNALRARILLGQPDVDAGGHAGGFGGENPGGGLF